MDADEKARREEEVLLKRLGVNDREQRNRLSGTKPLDQARLLPLCIAIQSYYIQATSTHGHTLVKSQTAYKPAIALSAAPKPSPAAVPAPVAASPSYSMSLMASQSPSAAPVASGMGWTTGQGAASSSSLLKACRPPLISLFRFPSSYLSQGPNWVIQIVNVHCSTDPSRQCQLTVDNNKLIRCTCTQDYGTETQQVSTPIGSKVGTVRLSSSSSCLRWFSLR